MHSPGRRRICSPHGRRARPLAEAPDPKRPVVCLDERPVQLIGEIRSRYRPSRDSSNATIASIAATAPSISSSYSTSRGLAQGQGHRAARGRGLRPMHARAHRRHYPEPNASALCRTICRSTRPARSMRHSRPPKLGASWVAWNCTTPQACQLAQLVEIEIGVRRQCLDRRIDDKALVTKSPLGTTAQRRRGRIKWM